MYIKRCIWCVCPGPTLTFSSPILHKPSIYPIYTLSIYPIYVPYIYTLYVHPIYTPYLYPIYTSYIYNLSIYTPSHNRDAQ